MAKQPLKKKEITTKVSLSDFKAKMGLGSKDEVRIETSNADKPLEWLVMPHAFQEALKIPGIPKNYVTTIVGHSNTGKSTAVNHAVIAAQKDGIIPVIYDTENNFDFSYAIDMGMEATPVYGDVEVEEINLETGESTTKIENKIIRYDGNFIYFNNAILADRYGKMDYSTGKENKTARKVAVIEDIAASINELLNAQDEGEIQAGFVFIWDSVGSISSFKSFKSCINNNMWDAGAISTAFNGIINSRIPGSRKVSSPYSNTLIFINKVWLDSMTSPVGPPSLSLKGGNSIFYGSRLIILLGGMLKGGAQKLVAQSKGLSYNYGILTKIKVLKNQLPSPYTVTYEGKLNCTMHGMFAEDEMDGYRKQYMGDILKQLNTLNNDENSNITEKDIEFETDTSNDIELD